MKKILLFVFLFFTKSLLGQEEPSPYKFTSLIDLFEFPTVHATGHLDVSIPLYTINNRELSIPVTLNYNQMGNTNVFYKGGEFGDAWVLSASGTISRECRDRPISLYSSTSVFSMCAGRNYTKETYRFYSLQNDEYYYSQNPSSTTREMPDIYTFSFLGLSGKFVIDRQGGQYVAKLIETSDFVTISIDSPPGGDNYNFQSITITDKNGFKYKFANPNNINQNESNKQVFAKGLGMIPANCSLASEGGDTPYEGVGIIDPGLGNPGNSSQMKNGDGLISFQVIPGTSTFWENLEITEIYDKNNVLLVKYEYDSIGVIGNGSYTWVNGLAKFQPYKKVYLKKINIIGQGSVLFNNVIGFNQTDVVNSYTTNIEIKDLKENIIKKIVFEYVIKGIHDLKYIKDNNDGSYGLSFHKRLLTSIKEYNNTSQNFLQTNFEYKDANITNTNSVVDRYGFLTKIGYCQNHKSLIDYKANSFILQKIKYPTGGSVIYDFEQHTFSKGFPASTYRDFNYDNHIYNNINLNKSGLSASFNGSVGDTIVVLNADPTNMLRLFRIVGGQEQLITSDFKNKDGITTLNENHCKHLLTKVVLPSSENNHYIFKYYNTSANISGLKAYKMTYSPVYINYCYAEGNRLSKIAYYENNVNKNILSTSGGELLAEKVIKIDYSDSTQANTSSGKVRTSYNADHEMRPFTIVYEQITTSIRGIGKKHIKYNFPNSNWNNNIRTDVSESKVYDLANHLITENTFDYTYNTIPVGSINYNHIKPFIVSDKVTTKNYEGNVNQSISVFNTYDATNYQLITSTNVDPLGKNTTLQHTYDIINNAVVNTHTKKLVNSSLVSEEKYTYDVNANLIKTEFKTPQMNSFEQTEMVNPKYSNGLLQGYTQLDGTPVTLIYGYKNTKLVAKMINVDPNVFYSTNLLYSIIRSNINSYSNQESTSYNETNLLSALNGLRSNFPNAYITTYTYKPLVGISSSTDENGKTTFYEYDTFNRLKSIKDHSGNILKEYNYNFTN